jgi:hypothetical protein
MVSRFNKSRCGVLAGVVLSAPLVLASACSEPTSSFFDPPMSGGTGGASGGSAGAKATGGTSAGKGGTAATGGSASGGAGSGGADTSGGASGNGSGGDAPVAGTAGADPGTGGTAGMDALGGEGGMGNEGGMSGGTGGNAGTAGSGGSAGTAGSAGTGGDGGTSGTAGAGGVAGNAGTAGAGGGAGLGGNAGNAGNGGNATGGTGGTGCTPKTEVCDGLDNDCGNDVDEGGVCPSGCHGGTLEGRTFLLCTTNNELEWLEARAFCMDADNGSGNVEVAGPMTVVEIRSAKENAFLVEWLEDEGIDENVWMGANDRGVEGQWQWDRGSGNGLLFFTVVGTVRMPVNGAYHDWPTGQPTYNGVDCGYFNATDAWHWNDGACTQSPLGAFICGEIP